MQAVVMGSGSWGTAMAKVLVDAGTPTVLWSRRPELADAINRTHTNPDYLPQVPLPEGLRASADLTVDGDVKIKGTVEIEGTADDGGEHRDHDESGDP